MLPLTVPIIMTPAPSAIAVEALSRDLESIRFALGVAASAAYNHTPAGRNLKAVIELPKTIESAKDKAKSYVTVALLIGGAFVALKLVQEGRKAFT